VQFVNNEPEQIKIRESQNTLIVVGSGTILFSIWSAVKMLGMLFVLRKETVAALLDITGPIEGISDRAVFWITAVVVILIMAVILGFRVYVGLSAIAVGRGKRRSWLFILIALIMILSSFTYFSNGLLTAEAPRQLGAFTRDQTISKLIIELTSVIMLTQMVISALRIRKLTGAKKTAKE